MIRHLRIPVLVWTSICTVLAPLAPVRAQEASTSAAVAVVPDDDATPLPGDQIAVRVWNEPSITGTYVVRESGEVVLPKFGPVVAVGRPIVALQDSLRDAYIEYVRNPSVEVAVLRRIRVGGEVRNPGIYMADLTMRLPEVIAAAGGLTEAANPNNIVVVRGERELRYRAANHGEFLAAELISGDNVLVRPKSALARNPLGTSTAVMGVVLTFVTVLLPAVKGLFE